MSTNDFGNYLRALRKSKSLTTRKVADLSGVSQSFISNLENGNRGLPSPEILQKLSTALGVNYIELMEKAGYLYLSEDNSLGSLLEDDLKKSLYESKVLGNPGRYNKQLTDDQLDQLAHGIPLSKREKGQEGTSIELFAILNNPNLTYQGQPLSEEDRQRIMDMLRLMFPNR